MTDTPNVQLTIDFSDPDTNLEKLETLTQNLWEQMRELDGVKVERIVDLNPPEGNRSVGGFLVGKLAAEVSLANIKKMLGFLGDRLGGKPIKIKVKTNGKEVEIEASSQQELLAAEQVVERILKSQ